MTNTAIDDLIEILKIGVLFFAILVTVEIVSTVMNGLSDFGIISTFMSIITGFLLIFVIILAIVLKLNILK